MSWNKEILKKGECYLFSKNGTEENQLARFDGWYYDVEEGMFYIFELSTKVNVPVDRLLREMQKPIHITKEVADIMIGAL